MAISSLRICSGLVVLFVAASTGRPAHAAPTAADALKLTPTQRDVEYDTPAKDEFEKCTIKAEKIGGQTGWVVRDRTGQILRKFADTNADNVVDQWSYFQDGLEVYRDIDADFNGKPDQYRWFNTAGIRWGIDTNEDGRVDRWKEISAEEVSSEIVAALADKDATRFARLLISAEELKGLGLSDARIKELEAKTAKAGEEFRKLASEQKTLNAKSRWLQFGGSRPGIVPTGTDGSTKDLIVYENAVAMVESDGKHDQLQIGTLIRVGDTWRAIGPPGEVGYFFTARATERAEDANANSTAGGPPQAYLNELERIDKELVDATSPQVQAKLTSDKADVIGQIAEAVGANSPEDRAKWICQMADLISATVQSGIWPEGVERLKRLHDTLAKDPSGEELASYVEFRYLTADYGRALSLPGSDFAKVQAAWLESLKKFVTDHPKSADTAEAMLQLAIAQEFAGQEDDAKKWYTAIQGGFPNTATARKAVGAVTRIDSVGKPLRLKGANADTRGKPLDIAQFAGKVVLIQFWATWCEPAKVDLAQLKVLQAQYGKDGFAILGVSLDSKGEDLINYLKKNPVPWPQIFEPGGLDSRVANELGILTLPTMMLVGKDGKVVNRSVHITELEREVGNLLK